MKEVIEIVEIETIQDAANIVEAVVGKAEPNETYNIYSCGHVTRRVDERVPAYYAHFRGRGRRACYTCKRGYMVTKYRKCQCGDERIGMRLKVGPGNCCGEKRWKPNDYQAKLERDARMEVEASGRIEKMAAARDRYDCANRGGCLTKTLAQSPTAEFIPWCYECEKYQPAPLNIDASVFAVRHGIRESRFQERAF